MMVLLLTVLATGVLAATESVGKTATEEIGVAYRGHVQNQGNMPKPEGTLVAGPDALGTRGQGLRVEGFWIQLTGDVPEDAKIVYQVHVQNEGWMSFVKNGDFAGTTGKSQRVESIKINLQNMPGYSVYYRGHVENRGDIPQADGEWGWVKDGEELGTTGSSLRLEELQIKIVKTTDLTAYNEALTLVEEADYTPESWKIYQASVKANAVKMGDQQTKVDLATRAIKDAQEKLVAVTKITVYDKAGTFGPKTGMDVIDQDVTIDVTGVVLQNLHIKGNLTIGEGVGEGDVTLNNITVDGETFVRGGGKNSIHINGGDYNKITIQQTSSGQVRIVATNAAGLEVVVSEDAKGEDIILEGAFENVQIDAPDVKISTQGETTIKAMAVAKGATGTEITLDQKTTVNNIDLNAPVDMKGEGTIEKANVNSDGVTFEQAPVKETVAPEVTVPPVVTPPTPPLPPTPPPTPTPTPEPDPPAPPNPPAPPTPPVGPTAEERSLVAQFNNAASSEAFVALLNTNALGLDLSAYKSLDEVGKYLVGWSLLKYDNFANKAAVQKAVNNALTTDEKVDAEAQAYLAALTTYAPTMEATEGGIKVSYPNKLSSIQKSILKGLYGDIIIYCKEPLKDDEAFELTAHGKTKIVKKEDFNGRNEVVLSKLLGITLGAENLVSNNQAEFTITYKDKSLVDNHVLEIYPCTTRNSQEFFKASMQGASINISPPWFETYEDYTKSVVISSQKSNFSIVHNGGLPAIVQARLAGCHVDTMFSLSRPLEEGELIKLSIDGNIFELTNQIITAANGNKIRQSELPGVNINDLPLAANHIGSSQIAILEKEVDMPLMFNIQLALTKGDKSLVYVDNDGISCAVFPNAMEHYTNGITLSSDDNKISLDYTGVAALSSEDKQALSDYQADVIIFLSRPLATGEVLKIAALGREVEIDSDTQNDVEHTKLRLSRLLGLTPAALQLAIEGNNPFEIVLTGSGLTSDLFVSANPCLANANDDLVELEISRGVYVKRACIDAYLDSMTVWAYNKKFTIASYANALTNEEKDGIAGYYADEWLYTDRPLSVDETLTLLVDGDEINLDSDNFTGDGVRLSELMQKNRTNEDLAIAQSGEHVITVGDYNLDSDIHLTVQPMLDNPNVWTRILYEKTMALTLPADYLEAYTNSVIVSGNVSGTAFTVTYLGGLSQSHQESLADYYSDAIITLNRKLEADETLTVSAFNQTINIGSTTVTENEGKEIRLSDLLGIELGEAQRAALQTGSFDVTITDRQLNSNLNIVAEAILVKNDNSILRINRSANLTVGRILPIQYQAFVETIGWQEWFSSGQIAGTREQNLPIKALRIDLPDPSEGGIPAGGTIQYRAYMGAAAGDGPGWLDWVNEGQMAGRTDVEECYLDAIQIKLIGMPEYSVQYQVKIIGENDWQPWVRDEEMAGTNGQNKHIEAIRMRIVQNP